MTDTYRIDRETTSPVMSSNECGLLLATVHALQAIDVPFALVHESAMMGWGIDNNIFLDHVDVLVVQEDGFETLGSRVPQDIREYVKVELAGVPTRLWSRSSLGIRGSIEVTSCSRYGCEALAPELVLRKLPYSPDAPMLMEQRARLASILMVDELTDEGLALVARYARGK